MQDLPKLHRNYSSGAITWRSLHPSEENILLLRHIDIYNHTPVLGSTGKYQHSVSGVPSETPLTSCWYFPVLPSSCLGTDSVQYSADQSSTGLQMIIQYSVGPKSGPQRGRSKHGDICEGPGAQGGSRRAWVWVFYDPSGAILVGKINSVALDWG